MIGPGKFEAKPVEPGLYIVATPIGNLSDITVRALEILAGCDVIACEDTRTSNKLLNRFNINARTIAYHEHNAEPASEKMLALLGSGKSIALISDAGTPLISDPGYRIVNLAVEAGHNVIPVPGASSLLTALMAAGLPTDSFYYGGFLPNKDKARNDRMQALAEYNATLVLFDSPHRIAASLKSAIEIFGADRTACVCRELTKAHEEFTRGTLLELFEDYSQRKVKGEIVLLIGPPGEENENEVQDITTLLMELSEEMSTSKAAGVAAEMTGRSRKELYQLLLSLKENQD